jgi:hypothetical protein
VRIGEEPYKVPPNDRVLNDFFPRMDRQLFRLTVPHLGTVLVF